MTDPPPDVLAPIDAAALLFGCDLRSDAGQDVAMARLGIALDTLAAMREDALARHDAGDPSGAFALLPRMDRRIAAVEEALRRMDAARGPGPAS